MKIKLIFIAASFLSLVVNAQDWPQRSGLNGNYVITDDLDVTDNYSYAVKLWKSEWTPQARGGSGAPGRYGCSNLGKGIGGGCGSPIIYNNKVYLWYYLPTGGPDSIYDTDMTDLYLNTCGYTLSDVYAQLGVLADEVFLCLDLNTGATIWKKTYPACSMYGEDQTKDQIRNYTMCAGAGRVYGFGTSGFVYCHDANDGTLLWKSQQPAYSTWQSYRSNAIALREQIDYPNGTRDHGSAAAFADSVVIIPDHAHSEVTLSGYDAITGNKLWTKSSILGKYTSPVLWKYNNKTYLITYNQTTSKLIDPKTGNELWTIPVRAQDSKVFDYCAYKNYLLVTKDVGGVAYPVIYQITPSSYSEVWVGHGAGNATGFIVEDTVWVKEEVTPGSKVYQLRKYNFKTDVLLASQGVVTNFTSLIYFDGIIYSEDDVMHSSDFYIMMKASTLEKITGTWKFSGGEVESGYEMSMVPAITSGKMVRRGADALYCYDISVKPLVLNSTQINPSVLYTQPNVSSQLSVTSFDTYGVVFTKPVTIVWTVLGNGTVTPGGLYTAPSDISPSERVVAAVTENGVTVYDTLDVHVKMNQTITCFKFDSVYYQQPPFKLHCEASSGLPVTITKTSGPCILRNDSIFPLGVTGKVYLTVAQAGNDIYNAAPTIPFNFVLASYVPNDVIEPPITGIVNHENKKGMAIYPVPANDAIYISGAEMMNYVLLDLTGRKIASGVFNTKLDVSGLKPGIYMILINGSAYRFIKR